MTLLYFLLHLITTFFTSTDYYLRVVLKCEDSQLSKLNEMKKAVSDYLSTEDEFINSNTRQPVLLVLAELIFRSCENFKVGIYVPFEFFNFIFNHSYFKYIFSEQQMVVNEKLIRSPVSFI